MSRAVVFLLFAFLFANQLTGQCDSLIVKVVDDFDSTRIFYSTAVNIGYLIPSQVETVEGLKLVEEAKAFFAFSENDTLESFFLTFAVQEREYRRVMTDTNYVLIKLNDGRILPLMSAPDKGVFDRNTNMRQYLHTCVIPYDLVFSLTLMKIDKIRIEYEGGYKHTITLIEPQKEALKQRIICVAEALGLLETKP